MGARIFTGFWGMCILQSKISNITRFSLILLFKNAVSFKLTSLAKKCGEIAKIIVATERFEVLKESRIKI